MLLFLSRPKCGLNSNVATQNLKLNQNLMTKNILKILGLAIAGSVFSSICASAAILSEMDSTNFQPAALDPTAFSGPSILGPSPSNTYSDMDAILGFRV